MWTTLESSNIAAADYDGDTQTLSILFRSGAEYRYRPVPDSVYTDLLEAPSAGAFFAQQIKGVYAYERV